MHIEVWEGVGWMAVMMLRRGAQHVVGECTVSGDVVALITEIVSEDINYRVLDQLWSLSHGCVICIQAEIAQFLVQSLISLVSSPERIQYAPQDSIDPLDYTRLLNREARLTSYSD